MMKSRMKRPMHRSRLQRRTFAVQQLGMIAAKKSESWKTSDRKNGQMLQAGEKAEQKNDEETVKPLSLWF